ncbi:MAG: hypothetical protein H0W96_09820 [Solirubrobacterales bacterium]|nr:hypothetical protein [Solirubrobacterales bacterium]
MKSDLDRASIACSLDRPDVVRRRARWRALAARGAVEAVPTGRGLRLTFRADAGVAAELDRLVAFERECCPWANWSVRSDGEQIELQVSGDSDETVAAVHGMLGSLVAPAT